MNISPKFMGKLRQRNNLDEIFYYAMRCLFNAGISRDQGDKKWEAEFLRQADQLGAMLPDGEHEEDKKVELVQAKIFRVKFPHAKVLEVRSQDVQEGGPGAGALLVL